MIVRRAHVYRLTPTPEQAHRLTRWVGAVRFVYNLALEQRRVFWRPGRKFDFHSQGKEVTALRGEVDWLRDVPADALRTALRDLDKAYSNWWSGRAAAPSPHKRGVHDSMRFREPGLTVTRLSRHLGEIKLAKIGRIRLRWDRPLNGKLRNVTVSHRAGQWFAACQYEYEVAEPPASVLPVVGIDRGVTVFAALSDGSFVQPTNHGKAALRAIARAQRNLARKKKGSNRRRKQVQRVARLHLRVANARKDFLHKTSTTIAKNHGTVVLEKLSVKNMTGSARGTAEEPGKNVRAKAGLNRAILDQGWGAFRVMLAYKLAIRGGSLVEVDPRYTSQTCAACGDINSSSRDGIRFLCVGCGHGDHADTNAAINIARLGARELVT